MAPRPGPAQVDLPAQERGRSPDHPRREGGPRPPAGAGEPALGASPHPGGAGPARPRRERLGRAGGPPAAPRPARAAAATSDGLARLPPTARAAAPRLRLLHRRDALPQDPARLVLY